MAIKFLKLEIPRFISVDNPPIKSLINEFDLIKAYIVPIQIRSEKILDVFELMEKYTIKIMGTKICKKSRDKNILNQDLKIQEVDGEIKLIILKGVRKIETFIIIYRNEYDIAKFKKPIDTKLLLKPSKVRKLTEESI